MSDLASVRDLDCLASFNPLRFDMGVAEVKGADAVLRRVLYRWCTAKGALRYDPGVGLSTPLLDLEGSTFDAAGLDGLRAALAREAADEDFVAAVEVTLMRVGSGRLTVHAAVTLIDGLVYELEVSSSAAGVALRAIGAT